MPASETLFHVLVALTTVLIVGRLLAVVFRYLAQPPVIGEVVGGIALGPSVLGQIWPEATAFLLPPAVEPFLGVIAQLGIILYMFVVGLELSLGTLRAQIRATLAISQASIFVPLLLGVLLAIWIYPRVSSSAVPVSSFALFLGVAMSVTAFPVLARILTDLLMQKTPLGTLALACAAVNDVTAWCLLALVVGVAQAKVGGAMSVLGWTLAYSAGMVFLVRPLVARWVSRLDEARVGPPVLAVVFTALLLSALATESIGIHAIFGAFLLGAIVPESSAMARTLPHKLEDLVTVLLLPAFFAFTGMRTRIGLVNGLEQWLICGLIIVVAAMGKLGGTLIAARFSGLGWRDAASLGTLMNTRGLMELIVLNIGLDLGVITPAVFSMMVLMALVTTLATAPLLRLWGVDVVPATTADLDRQP